MTQNFERAKSRLNNIQTIQPLLTALRTMSMGAWQMANNRIAFMNKYKNNYDRILIEVLPYIKRKRSRQQRIIDPPLGSLDTIYLLIGSERGLCGRFNISIAEKALDFIESENRSSHQIWVMGSRLVREVQRRGAVISWHQTLPASSLFTYEQSFALIQNWLEQYEGYHFNRFVILFNQIVRANIYRFSNTTLLPYQLDVSPENKTQVQEIWPPSIIETEPAGVYNKIIQHYITSNFHQAVLFSAAAEHSARYNLMQEASDNAEEIIEDLQRVINAERKRQITEEMQELAVSAGLIET